MEFGSQEVMGHGVNLLKQNIREEVKRREWNSWFL